MYTRKQRPSNGEEQEISPLDESPSGFKLKEQDTTVFIPVKNVEPKLDSPLPKSYREPTSVRNKYLEDSNQMNEKSPNQMRSFSPKITSMMRAEFAKDDLRHSIKPFE